MGGGEAEVQTNPPEVQGMATQTEEIAIQTDEIIQTEEHTEAETGALTTETG